VRTGYLIDGHERVMQALGLGDDTLVPVIQVDLDEAEERQALATFDFITYMAEYSREMLAELIPSIETNNAHVLATLDELATNNGVAMLPDDQWSSAFDMLPDSDRAPFQQKTFTLHDEQAATVDEAIKLAHSLGEYVDSPNENSNGNALARICEVFITQNGQR
jgi:ParB family transcriptional regulator, chromosome partitioning protein